MHLVRTRLKARLWVSTHSQLSYLNGLHVGDLCHSQVPFHSQQAAGSVEALLNLPKCGLTGCCSLLILLRLLLQLIHLSLKGLHNHRTSNQWAQPITISSAQNYVLGSRHPGCAEKTEVHGARLAAEQASHMSLVVTIAYEHCRAYT